MTSSNFKFQTSRYIRMFQSIVLVLLLCTTYVILLHIHSIFNVTHHRIPCVFVFVAVVDHDHDHNNLNRVRGPGPGPGGDGDGQSIIPSPSCSALLFLLTYMKEKKSKSSSHSHCCSKLLVLSASVSASIFASFIRISSSCLEHFNSKTRTTSLSSLSIIPSC